MPGREGGGLKRTDVNGSRYKAVKRSLRNRGLPCWICGGAIRYDLPPGHPLSFEYDHYFPASRWMEFGYPSLAAATLDPANGRASHRICNQRRGDSMPGEPRWLRMFGCGEKREAHAPTPPEKRSHAT